MIEQHTPEQIDALWTRERIAALPIADLKAIVRSTNPNGAYWPQVAMAKDLLRRRARS